MDTAATPHVVDADPQKFIFSITASITGFARDVRAVVANVTNDAIETTSHPPRRRSSP